MPHHAINPFNAARIARQSVQAAQPFSVVDLFSGIDGFSLGPERAGSSTVVFCEIDPFCRRILPGTGRMFPCTMISTKRTKLEAWL